MFMDHECISSWYAVFYDVCLVFSWVIFFSSCSAPYSAGLDEVVSHTHFLFRAHLSGTRENTSM